VLRSSLFSSTEKGTFSVLKSGFRQSPLLALVGCYFDYGPGELLTSSLLFIGQWAPIVGTVLAVIGSLYILLAADLEVVTVEANHDGPGHDSNPSIEGVGLGLTLSHSGIHPPDDHVSRSLSNGERGTSEKIGPTISHHSPAPGHLKRSWTIDAGTGKRREVAKMLTSVGNYLGTARRGTFDYSEFQHGEAQDFPEIPGEEHRNRALRQIREQYNQYRNADGDITPRPASRVSFTGSATSGTGRRASSMTPRESSPFPSPTAIRKPQAISLLYERSSFELQDPPLSAGSTAGRRQRRDTLEVPSPVHHRSASFSSFIRPITTAPEGPGSPSIVVSSDLDPDGYRSPSPSSMATPSESSPASPTAVLPPST
jgi:hypothetical protein